MLRRILIASAAAAMLLVTFTTDDANARGRGGGGYRVPWDGPPPGRQPHRRACRPDPWRRIEPLRTD